MPALFYNPKKPVFLLSQPLASLEMESLRRIKLTSGSHPAVGFLCFLHDHALAAKSGLEQILRLQIHLTALSKTDDLAESAASLFDQLKEMDINPAIRVIFIEPCPHSSTNLALISDVEDKLRRIGRPL